MVSLPEFPWTPKVALRWSINYNWKKGMRYTNLHPSSPLVSKPHLSHNKDKKFPWYMVIRFHHVYFKIISPFPSLILESRSSLAIKLQSRIWRPLQRHFVIQKLLLPLQSSSFQNIHQYLLHRSKQTKRFKSPKDWAPLSLGSKLQRYYSTCNQKTPSTVAPPPPSGYPLSQNSHLWKRISGNSSGPVLYPLLDPEWPEGLPPPLSSLLEPLSLSLYFCYSVQSHPIQSRSPCGNFLEELRILILNMSCNRPITFLQYPINHNLFQGQSTFACCHHHMEV